MILNNLDDLRFELVFGVLIRVIKYLLDFLHDAVLN